MTHVGMLEGLSVRRALELNIKSHLRQHAHRLKVALSFFTALLCCISKLIISSVQTKNADLQWITYHLFCWSCTRQCWLHVCIWWGPPHTSYCTTFSLVCQKEAEIIALTATKSSNRNCSHWQCLFSLPYYRIVSRSKMFLYKEKHLYFIFKQAPWYFPRPSLDLSSPWCPQNSLASLLQKSLPPMSAIELEQLP